MALFVSVQLFDLAYWFTKTRNRGHFKAREFAAKADEFYREQTGRDIPVAFGSMWYAGCVMHYLPYRPYAGSAEDPYDEFRFRDVLDHKGALGVYLDDEDAAQLADTLKIDEAELKKNAHMFTFHYQAPYGKRKERNIFFVAIPPRKGGPASEQNGN